MEQRALPKSVNPYKLAAKQESIEGWIDIKYMERLTEFKTCYGGRLTACLAFDIDSEQRCYIKGNAAVCLELICQRCLAPFELTINPEFCLSPVKTEKEGKDLPDQYEPVLCEREVLNIPVLLEDEVLLELPAFPKHGYNCK